MQRWMRHDPVEGLRPEPVGEQFGAHEGRFWHHHLVGQRPAPPADLLPDAIAGREAPVGVVKLHIDAVGAETAEFMGPHVLQAKPDARGVRSDAIFASVRSHWASSAMPS